MISEWAVIFRYENFFIPRVEKISPWEKNLASRGPMALGRTRFFALGLIFEDFSTLGMKKFPYLKTGPFGNPIFFLPAYSLIMWFIRSPKIFFKIAIWKYDSWFPSEVSKITSARNKLNLPLNYLFLLANVVFWICYGSKKWSKNHLDTIQTTFSKNDSY